MASSKYVTAEGGVLDLGGEGNIQVEAIPNTIVQRDGAGVLKATKIVSERNTVLDCRGMGYYVGDGNLITLAWPKGQENSTNGNEIIYTFIFDMSGWLILTDIYFSILGQFVSIGVGGIGVSDATAGFVPDVYYISVFVMKGQTVTIVIEKTLEDNKGNIYLAPVGNLPSARIS